MNSVRDGDPVQAAAESFRRHYGYMPQSIASAPGRVNLIGEHTDYNDGLVLPMAIDYRTAIAAARNESDRVVMRSAATGEDTIIDLSQPLAPGPRGSWSNYPKGVIAGFIAAGYVLEGFDALIQSRVPIGAGLASSAALETATAALLESMSGTALGVEHKAVLCQRAEQTFASVPCGIMDPYICIAARAGYAVLLDCRSNEAEWLALDDPSVSVLIINTNVKHQLANGEYALRRQACEAAARTLSVRSLREADMELLETHAQVLERGQWRYARHVIGEIARTVRAADCIRRREWSELGRLLDASHDSLKNDFGVSCAELDAVVDIARGLGPGAGVLGCRLTGGGFGGCVVALIETAQAASISQHVGVEYHRRTGIAASLFTSRPADGASVVEV